METFRRAVRTFGNERYPLWDGTLYSNHRGFLLGENQDNLQTVVRQIDENMRLVNNRRTELENEIFRQEGILGSLRATLNSIVTAIQNWID